MPTVLRTKGYRLFFYSRELNEPAHVHVEKEGKYAKFWLSPPALCRNRGFRPHELSKIGRLVESHATRLLENWNEHFGVSQ